MEVLIVEPMKPCYVREISGLFQLIKTLFDL